MIHSYKVLATLSAYRGVAAVSGTAFTVQYPESNSNPFLGVTKDTVLDTTGAIPVVGIGERAKLYFNDTVGAGQIVGLDSSGRGVPVTLANTTTSLTVTSQIIGILLGDSVSATGTIAEILVQPGFVR